MATKTNNRYNCISCCTVVISFLSICLIATFWVQYHNGTPDYEKAKAIKFTEIEGGCTIERDHLSPYDSCSTGGGGLTTCNCHTRARYNVTVNAPTGNLNGEHHGYTSELVSRWFKSGRCNGEISTDLVQSDASKRCWYSDEPDKAKDAGFRCGQPQCMRVGNPDHHLETLDPGEAPVTFTIACSVVWFLICFLCVGPIVRPDEFAQYCGIEKD